MFSFHVVPHLRDSLLVFVLFPLGFETVPHLLRWRDSSHSPLQIHIGERWIIPVCFPCWLEGHPCNRVPMEKSTLETGEVKGEKIHCCLCHRFSETRIKILVFLKSHRGWGAVVMYMSHCVVPFGKPHKIGWWIEDYGKVRMCCVVLSIRC